MPLLKIKNNAEANEMRYPGDELKISRKGAKFREGAKSFRI